MNTGKLTSPELLPHQQDIVDEVHQLLTKVERLQNFMESRAFDALLPLEKVLLRARVKAMNGYAAVLVEHLEYWGLVK